MNESPPPHLQLQHVTCRRCYSLLHPSQASAHAARTITVASKLPSLPSQELLPVLQGLMKVPGGFLYHVWQAGRDDATVSAGGVAAHELPTHV